MFKKGDLITRGDTDSSSPIALVIESGPETTDLMWGIGGQGDPGSYPYYISYKTRTMEKFTTIDKLKYGDIFYLADSKLKEPRIRLSSNSWYRIKAGNVYNGKDYATFYHSEPVIVVGNIKDSLIQFHEKLVERIYDNH